VVSRTLRTRAGSPFKDLITVRGVKFCEPTIRVGIEFVDFTDDGYLRRAAFRRFDDELITVS
jgi:hypothetical protein